MEQDVYLSAFSDGVGKAVHIVEVILIVMCALKSALHVW